MSLALYQQDQVRETEQGVEEEENTMGEETLPEDKACRKDKKAKNKPVKVSNPNPDPV